MIIAGIDVETTGLPELAKAVDAPPREVIELGYCVYDTNTNKSIAGGSDLFEPEVWDELAEESVKHHGITKEQAALAGLKPAGFDVNRILRYKPRVVVAHNAPFDKSWVVPLWPELNDIEWLCTMRDFNHSKIVNGKISLRLMHLAIEYGIPVLNWHRAHSDAEMACKIAAKHSLEEAIIQKNLSRYSIKTTGIYDDMMRLKLKEFNFRWENKDKHPPKGCWIKEDVTEIDMPLIKNTIAGLRPDWWLKVEEMTPAY